MKEASERKQQCDWWNRAALSALTLMVVLTIWLTACSSGVPPAAKTEKAAANSPATTQGPMPASLSNAGEYGENVYDYAKAKDWKNADVKIAALRDAVKNVGTDVNNKKAVEGLFTDVGKLGDAVTAGDRQAAMREANQVTVDVADISTAFKLRVPVEVTKLDYFGRELEVWAQANEASKLQVTAREMRRTWDSLRPSIAGHSAPEAKKFDALVARVESARTPEDYARLATPVLNEVDNLEKLFQ